MTIIQHLTVLVTSESSLSQACKKACTSFFRRKTWLALLTSVGQQRSAQGHGHWSMMTFLPKPLVWHSRMNVRILWRSSMPRPAFLASKAHRRSASDLGHLSMMTFLHTSQVWHSRLKVRVDWRWSMPRPYFFASVGNLRLSAASVGPGHLENFR